MFDIGFFEILVIAVVALLVLGPEKMPHAVRMTAAYWGRLKRAVITAKSEIEDELALEDIKRQLRAETTPSKMPGPAVNSSQGTARKNSATADLKAEDAEAIAARYPDDSISKDTD